MQFIKNRHPKRFIKFSIVGFVNFLIDFSVLNILSFSTGVNKGFFAAIFSTIAFLVANINSYYLNKRWTFKKDSFDSSYKAFLTFSVVGVAINAALVYFATSLVQQNYFSALAWLNISKLAAVVLVAVFNYFCYKKYVFGKSAY